MGHTIQPKSRRQLAHYFRLPRYQSLYRIRLLLNQSFAREGILNFLVRLDVYRRIALLIVSNYFFLFNTKPKKKLNELLKWEGESQYIGR